MNCSSSLPAWAPCLARLHPPGTFAARLRVAAFLFLIAPLALAADTAPDPDPDPDPALTASIRAAEAHFKASFRNATVQGVAPGPLPGLFEIQVGANLLYFAPEQKLLFVGEVWAEDGRSLTAERRAELDRTRLMALDVSVALTLPGDGNGDGGAAEIIEFVDTDCPYCARLGAWLDARPDITRHVFFVPLDSLHPDAAKRARHVLCAPDPRAALRAVYAREIPNADLIDCPDGRARLAAQRALAKQIGVDATPTTFVGPARQRVNGFQPQVIDTLLPLTPTPAPPASGDQP